MTLELTSTTMSGGRIRRFRFTVLPTDCTGVTPTTGENRYFSLSSSQILAFFQYKSPYHADQSVLLATFPLGPFLCLHLLLVTLNI